MYRCTSEQVEDYLRRNSSRNRPVKGRVIAEHFGSTGIDIRRVVNDLRCAGVPVCSSSNGYFYSEDLDDVRNQADSMLGRISSQQNAVSGLYSYLKKNRR